MAQEDETFPLAHLSDAMQDGASPGSQDVMHNLEIAYHLACAQLKKNRFTMEEVLELLPVAAQGLKPRCIRGGWEATQASYDAVQESGCHPDLVYATLLIYIEMLSGESPFEELSNGADFLTRQCEKMGSLKRPSDSRLFRKLAIKYQLEDATKAGETILGSYSHFDDPYGRRRLIAFYDGVLLALDQYEARLCLSNSDLAEIRKEQSEKLERAVENIRALSPGQEETSLAELLHQLVAELEAILKSAKRILGIIRKEVEELREKYGDERRTKIIPGPVGEFSMEDLVPEEETLVMMTMDGYIKRLPPDTFRTQGRGGKGVVGLATKEEDQVKRMFTTNTHSEILFFTNRGRVFRLKAYDLPQGSRTSKGQAIVNFLQLAPGERVSAILPKDDVEGAKYLVMVTTSGTIKKTALEEFDNVRRSGLIALNLHEGDDLLRVKPSTGGDDISMVTQQGQSIRFSEKNVRGMGRTAAGVRGMKLKKNDVVVGMDIIDPKKADKGDIELFTITENGMGKRTSLKEYKQQGRGGSGVRTTKVTAKTGRVVAAYISSKEDDSDLVMISKKGIVVRTPFKSVPSLGRDTQGVRLMRFKEPGDLVSSVTFV